MWKACIWERGRRASRGKGKEGILVIYCTRTKESSEEGPGERMMTAMSEGFKARIARQPRNRK
jgi:hypothetical protein